MTSSDTYTHGHHDSVMRSHRWRTAENSAAYLLSSLQSGMSVLDVGCGPGTITADLARRVAPGSVLGIDREEAPLVEARETGSGLSNLRFAQGDVNSLEVERDSLDIVHAPVSYTHLTLPTNREV